MQSFVLSLNYDFDALAWSNCGKRLYCLSTISLIFPHEHLSFYALSDMALSLRSVTTSILNPVLYRSKQHGSLATAHNYSTLETCTPLTRRMYDPVSNNDENISVLIILWATLSCSPSPSTYLGLSHYKHAPRENDHYFLTSVTYPTIHTTGTT